jgi:hypothetical protein
MNHIYDKFLPKPLKPSVFYVTAFKGAIEKINNKIAWLEKAQRKILAVNTFKFFEWVPV